MCVCVCVCVCVCIECVFVRESACVRVWVCKRERGELRTASDRFADKYMKSTIVKKYMKSIYRFID